MINETVSTKFVSKDEIALNYRTLLDLGLALAVEYLHIQWEEYLRNDSRTYSRKVCHELDVFHLL